MQPSMLRVEVVLACCARLHPGFAESALGGLRMPECMISSKITRCSRDDRIAT